MQCLLCTAVQCSLCTAVQCSLLLGPVFSTRSPRAGVPGPVFSAQAPRPGLLGIYSGRSDVGIWPSPSQLSFVWPNGLLLAGRDGQRPTASVAKQYTREGGLVLGPTGCLHTWGSIEKVSIVLAVVTYLNTFLVPRLVLTDKKIIHLFMSDT